MKKLFPFILVLSLLASSAFATTNFSNNNNATNMTVTPTGSGTSYPLGSVVWPVTNGGTAGNGTTNAQTGSSYIFAIGDSGNFVTMNNSGASTLTIPPNSSVAYPINTLLCAQQIGAGSVTLTEGSGVTFTDVCTAPTAPVFSAQYAVLCAFQTATNVWAVTGKCQ